MFISLTRHEVMMCVCMCVCMYKMCCMYIEKMRARPMAHRRFTNNVPYLFIILASKNQMEYKFDQ